MSLFLDAELRKNNKMNPTTTTTTTKIVHEENVKISIHHPAPPSPPALYDDDGDWPIDDDDDRLATISNVNSLAIFENSARGGGGEYIMLCAVNSVFHSLIVPMVLSSNYQRMINQRSGNTLFSNIAFVARTPRDQQQDAFMEIMEKTYGFLQHAAVGDQTEHSIVVSKFFANNSSSASISWKCEEHECMEFGIREINNLHLRIGGWEGGEGIGVHFARWNTVGDFLNKEIDRTVREVGYGMSCRDHEKDNISIVHKFSDLVSCEVHFSAHHKRNDLYINVDKNSVAWNKLPTDIQLGGENYKLISIVDGTQAATGAEESLEVGHFYSYVRDPSSGLPIKINDVPRSATIMPADTKCYPVTLFYAKIKDDVSIYAAW
jgi:hypothetical protein